MVEHRLAYLGEVRRPDSGPGEHRAHQMGSLLMDAERVVVSRGTEVAERQRARRRDYVELPLDLLAQRVDVCRLEHLARDLALVDLLQHGMRSGVVAPVHREPGARAAAA